MPREVHVATIERYLGWLAAQAALTGSVAWVAFQLQQEQVSPAVLFPMLVGAVLGAGIFLISRATGVRRCSIMIGAAFVAGLMVVIGQDYIGHWHRLRDYADEIRTRSDN